MRMTSISSDAARSSRPISLALTRAGRLRLAAWLKTPEMNVVEIHARQVAVQELRDNVDLREDLATTGTEVVHEVESAKLDEWGAMPAIAFTSFEQIVMLAVPIVSLVLVAIVIANYRVWPVLLLGFAIGGIAARSLQERVARIVTAVERAEPALALLGGFLLRLERESFHSETPARLHARIGGAHLEIEQRQTRRPPRRAAQSVLRAHRHSVVVDAQRRRRHRALRSLHGARILDWIDVVAEFEALSSLSSFAFENPSFTTPTVVQRGPLFDAKNLGHPLIPDYRRVPNDLRLDDTRRLFIVKRLQHVGQEHDAAQHGHRRGAGHDRRSRLRERAHDRTNGRRRVDPHPRLAAGKRLPLLRKPAHPTGAGN